MRQPTLQYWTWSRTVPQFLTLALSAIIAWLFLPPGNEVLAVVIGPSVYLLYSHFSRRFIASQHHSGMKEAARKNYSEAIPHFQKSVEFFSRHQWLDRYRSFFLMSPSVWTYREMGLVNIASMHSALGNIESAKATFEAILSDYPDNDFAADSLKFLKAASGAGEA